MGCSIIEKPFCPDPTISEIDTPWALALDRLAEVDAKVWACWEALGTKNARSMITPPYNPARMCLVAKRDLEAGERITLESVRFAWPPRGISTYDWGRVDGAILIAPVAANTPIQWQDVDIDSAS